MSLPECVTLHEVGPRDGLQNEKTSIPTETKVQFIDRLSDTGLQRVEATSFVSPDWVPQLSDADEVMERISRKKEVAYPVLVPNETGLERALEADVRDIAVFTAASETFCQKNINCSITESLKRYRSLVERARHEGMNVRGYISCVAGCPYEGDVPERAVVEVACALREIGCHEISLGDTIGVGTPEHVRSLVRKVKRFVDVDRLALHCHDTYGQALANIYAGLQHGIRIVDSSVAGLGGCPYAKSATGNVATEDVLYMLDGMGIETGVDLEKIVNVARFISGVLDREPASQVARVWETDDRTS